MTWAVSTAAAPEADRFVYSRSRSGLMIRTGSSEDRLAHNQGVHLAPRISPDGTGVLYSSFEVPVELDDCGIGLWIVEVQGGAKARICDGQQGVWSLDGGAILFQRAGRLIERDLASGAERPVSPEGGPPLAHPAYAGGSGIVCVDGAGKRLYRIRAEGNPQLEPLLEGEFRSAPRCSPDGKTLAYQNGAHIHVLDLVTGETRQLTFDPGIQTSPAWSADGTGLCYAQAVAPFEPLWEIRHVALAEPWAAHRVERRVHPTFDWRGTSPDAWSRRMLRGGSLTLWRGPKALDLAEALKAEGRPGWERVAADTVAAAEQGSLIVENDWLLVSFSADGIVLAPKAEEGAKDRVVLSVAGMGVLAAAQAARNTAEEVVVEVRFSDGGEKTAKASFRVPRTRPFVEVTPPEQTAAIQAQAGLSAVVVPDWFANDLIVMPEEARAGESIALPQTPVALGCIEETGSTLMLAAVGEHQALAVANGPDGKGLTGITVSAAGQHSEVPNPKSKIQSPKSAVVVAVLAGRRMWPRPNVAPGAQGKSWRVSWEKPFHAAWRLAAQGKEGASARTWDEEALARLGFGPLLIDPPLAAAPEAAVTYAWRRDAHTPEDVLLPVDILVDVLGIQGYADAFDVAGVRGYRSGLNGVPIRELSLRGSDWRPWVSYAENDGYGVLEVMAAAFPAGTPGTRSLLTGLGNDALDLLNGLDARIQEYDEALQHIAAFCTSRGDGALAAIAAQAQEALQVGQGARRTDIAWARRALEAVLGILGTRGDRRLQDVLALCELFEDEPKARETRESLAIVGAKEGRLWHDDVICYELTYEDEFSDFSRACRRVLRERGEILAGNRAAMQGIRDAAGRLVTADPERKEAADQLRAMTQACLRHRQFLEGDWRGEEPLEGGEAS